MNGIRFPNNYIEVIHVHAETWYLNKSLKYITVSP